MSTQAEDGAGIPVDTFELRLAIARAYAGGLSAREAAFRVGVSGQTWRNWESGSYVGGAKKPSMLSFIARQLGVDEEWLREGGPLRTNETPRPDGPDEGQECAHRDSNPEPADLEPTAGDYVGAVLVPFPGRGEPTRLPLPA